MASLYYHKSNQTENCLKYSVQVEASTLLRKVKYQPAEKAKNVWQRANRINKKTVNNYFF